MNITRMTDEAISKEMDRLAYDANQVFALGSRDYRRYQLLAAELRYRDSQRDASIAEAMRWFRSFE